MFGIPRGSELSLEKGHSEDLNCVLKDVGISIESGMQEALFCIWQGCKLCLERSRNPNCVWSAIWI